MRKLRINKRKKKGVDFTNANCGAGTIMAALEKILTIMEDAGLDEEPLSVLKEDFDFLEEKLSFTCMQSMVVAMLIDSSSILETRAMARFLGIKNIKMLRYIPEIEELVKRGIALYKEDNFDTGYRISPMALSAYMKNEVFVPESTKNLTTAKLVDAVNGLIYEYRDSNISYEQLYSAFEDLMSNNCRHFLCKRSAELSQVERVFFFLCLVKYVYEGDLNITEHDCMQVFTLTDSNFLRGVVQARRGLLFKEKLLGDAVVNGFAPREACAISDEIREYINGELNLDWEQEALSSSEGLLAHGDIKEKALFYNNGDAVSIERLSQMLQQENFLAIQERLKEGGVRTGFACLFYGAPGTGKTESVLQIARRTGRDIMQVNVASIKSKWVGESEKNIRAIFDRYRRCCQKCEKKPILLFNEADAIINKRSTNIDRSVDKMENAIQNIILEEIEKLDGILIATTNLTDNMDSAFERRFIYKIEFHKPDVETKANIWQSMFSGLSECDAKVLAKEFDLSGGQIENVMRKQFVDNVLYDEQATLDKLRHYCTQERMGSNANSRTRIGF